MVLCPCVSPPRWVVATVEQKDHILGLIGGGETDFFYNWASKEHEPGFYRALRPWCGHAAQHVDQCMALRDLGYKGPITPTTFVRRVGFVGGVPYLRSREWSWDELETMSLSFLFVQDVDHPVRASDVIEGFIRSGLDGPSLKEAVDKAREEWRIIKIQKQEARAKARQDAANDAIRVAANEVLMAENQIYESAYKNALENDEIVVGYAKNRSKEHRFTDIPSVAMLSRDNPILDGFVDFVSSWSWGDLQQVSRESGFLYFGHQLASILGWELTPYERKRSTWGSKAAAVWGKSPSKFREWFLDWAKRKEKRYQLVQKRHAAKRAKGRPSTTWSINPVPYPFGGSIMVGTDIDLLCCLYPAGEDVSKILLWYHSMLTGTKVKIDDEYIPYLTSEKVHPGGRKQQFVDSVARGTSTEISLFGDMRVGEISTAYLVIPDTEGWTNERAVDKTFFVKMVSETPALTWGEFRQIKVKKLFRTTDGEHRQFVLSIKFPAVVGRHWFVCYDTRGRNGLHILGQEFGEVGVHSGYLTDITSREGQILYFDPGEKEYKTPLAYYDPPANLGGGLERPVELLPSWFRSRQSGVLKTINM